MQPWLLASSLIYMDLHHFNYVLLACLVLRLNFCVIFVMTSTAISVDRLLALLLGLWYRHVVTLPRVRVATICFWLIGISVEAITFWNVSIAITAGCLLSFFSVTISAFCYSTIYVKLRQHQLQMSPLTQGQPNSRELPLNITRYKSSVSSVKWVQVVLLACYIPLVVVTMLLTHGLIPESQTEIAGHVSVTFVYVSSSLNPILYCWKIRSVRQAAKDTIKQVLSVLS